MKSKRATVMTKIIPVQGALNEELAASMLQLHPDSNY